MSARNPVLVSALALLLLASAGTFAVGISMEQSQGHQQVQASSVSLTSESVHQEQGSEGAIGGTPVKSPEASLGNESGQSTPVQEAQLGILGISPESPVSIGAVVLASAVLALAVWLFSSRPWLLWMVALFGVVFTAFDVREVIVQAGRGNGPVVAVAVLVAILHIGVAVVAIVLVQRSRVVPAHH